MPDIRAFMGSGYFNGKIYLVGGYTTGNVDPSFGQVWEYDPVLNTFDTTRASMPATLGGPGFGIINGHMYIAGGRDLANTNLNTLYDYDIAANTWTPRANLPSGVNVPGSAVIAGKLWVFGGGNPFAGSGTSPTSANKGVRAWLKRLFTPDTTNTLQVYDPATNSWTSGPTLGQQRSFPAGTDVGNTAVAVGGYTGSSTTTSVEINVAGRWLRQPNADSSAYGNADSVAELHPGRFTRSMEHRLAISDTRRALRLCADRHSLLRVRRSVRWHACEQRQSHGHCHWNVATPRADALYQ